jgi:hypothetical protein
MAKAAFAQMKEFVETASYHQGQIDMLSKSVKDVTFMLTTKPAASITGSDTGSTSEPASSKPSAQEVPLDPEQVRKSSLIETLQAHEAAHGTFDIDVDVIASFLMAK